MINKEFKQNQFGSFRDPDGYVFSHNNILYRFISLSYKDDYDHLISSGLYKKLTEKGLLVKHTEIKDPVPGSERAYKIIQPELIPFISYPYEWCFSQLKNAALAALKIQKMALESDMTLKDCSAYNIQFKDNHPILIDTLSFTKYKAGQIWTGYRQFCQHFIAPLALMLYKDPRLNHLSKIFIDGIPLDLAGRLLPLKSRLNLPLLLHIHLHGRLQNLPHNKNFVLKYKPRKTSLAGLIDQLLSSVQNLKLKPKNSLWDKYYQDIPYSQDAFEHKKKIVSGFIDKISPVTVWDLGANRGVFSSIFSKKNILTIAFDKDHSVVENLFLNCLKEKNQKILPLVQDLTNPSSDIGWANNERMSLSKRAPCDAALALALIHHFILDNNLSFQEIAQFFSRICSWAIVEFTPQDDIKVEKLFSNRKDIFKDYTKENFESAFRLFFSIESEQRITGSSRIVYLMKNSAELRHARQ